MEGEDVEISAAIGDDSEADDSVADSLGRRIIGSGEFSLDEGSASEELLLGVDALEADAAAAAALCWA